MPLFISLNSTWNMQELKKAGYWYIFLFSSQFVPFHFCFVPMLIRYRTVCDVLLKQKPAVFPGQTFVRAALRDYWPSSKKSDPLNSHLTFHHQFFLVLSLSFSKPNTLSFSCSAFQLISYWCSTFVGNNRQTFQSRESHLVKIDDQFFRINVAVNKVSPWNVFYDIKSYQKR